MSPIPEKPEIYHIVHVDKLASIIDDGCIWSDREILKRDISSVGTIIGMPKIKRRRLEELRLFHYPDLFVGDCVPFYFCPRSVMLYMLHKGNHPELCYSEGQEAIIHLVADLHKVVRWAEINNRPWLFTLSNAGSTYFEERVNLSELREINWEAVNAEYWSECREQKQAEFLFAHSFPWQLVEKIGVYSRRYFEQVKKIVGDRTCPSVEIKPEWYY